jgi:hypothetical protein
MHDPGNILILQIDVPRTIRIHLLQNDIFFLVFVGHFAIVYYNYHAIDRDPATDQIKTSAWDNLNAPLYIYKYSTLMISIF